MTVHILPEKEVVSPKEIVYFNIQLQGENGVIDSGSDRKISAEVTGGELLGFGSANPCTEESYLEGTFTTYYGRAQAIVRAGDSKEVTLKIKDGEKQYISNVKIN